MPRSWGEHNWHHGVNFAEARELVLSGGGGSAQERQRRAAEFEGCDSFGFLALPMGHAWAPSLAQGCLEYNLASGLAGPCGDQGGSPGSAIGVPPPLVLHGHPTPSVDRGRPTVMPYLDDFLGIGTSCQSSAMYANPSGAMLRAKHHDLMRPALGLVVIPSENKLFPIRTYIRKHTMKSGNN